MTSGTKSLKDYLKRYESKDDEENKKKRKKKKQKVKVDGPGVLVVDEDPVWQKPIKLDEEEDNDSADEEKPQVDEDIEVKRMKRLEHLRLRRGYNVIAEDGSGWVSLASNGENVGDISPPRRRRARNDTPSPEPGERDFDAGRKHADLSPPRQRRRHHRTQSPDANPDSSPPHKQKARNDTPSPDPAMKDDDLSPPRKWKAQNDTPPPDPSMTNDDLSPPRKQKARNDTLSPDPSMKDADLLPRQRRQNRHYTPSPERPHDSNTSPPCRSHARNSEFSGRKFEAPDAHTFLGSDLSPPRKNRANIEKSGSPDLSPPRLPRRSSSTADGISRAYSDKDASVTRKTQKDSSDPISLKERPKTGLITGHDIQEEISKTKKNDLLRFEQMDPSMSGRGAEAVYRDKKGQRISKEEYLKSKQKVEEKPKEKKLEWGKGLAQKREAEARLQELELEKEKPFARTRDDPELDKMLKERLRWGDPMAHLVKKKHPEPVLADLGDSEKMKESGFIVPQEIPNHSWIKRGLDAAPNRYGIKPGRHWDGVDRSNGFEKKMFQRLNEKQATEKEAYLWSVSDM
ncbi:BUD13 homolog [Ricinus communis]|uniref:BUD13 homolog n=1 Tax=Ricinus communis TaxID=3988 RepID=UPI00201B0D64|nr:BUD13 homolog [Ricinus communis]XP_015583155.2 BUD13 homolog [Ricinus communis]XP_015583156.2 BUD13 homolog [Ricinus communis]XP_048230457.1 BUD13 homolog [Ricinus communis]XP_048230461.1 BUD13 homolog [Ricinus communis]